MAFAVDGAGKPMRAVAAVIYFRSWPFHWIGASREDGMMLNNFSVDWFGILVAMRVVPALIRLQILVPLPPVARPLILPMGLLPPLPILELRCCSLESVAPRELA